MERKAPYHAYLIRLWPTELAGATDYRVSLQDVSTGQSVQLPDLAGLLAHLQATRSAGRGDTQPGDTATELLPDDAGRSSTEPESSRTDD